MKTLLKTSVIIASLFSASTFAAGWSFSMNQGTFELYGAAAKGDYALVADCNNQGDIPDIQLFVQLPNNQTLDLQKDGAPGIKAIVDGKTMDLYGANSMVGMNNYSSFWQAVQAAKNKAVTIILPNGKRFTIPATNIKSVLFTGNETCTVG